MARWKLITAHCLNVQGNEWEYTETDRATGKPKRRKFPVPMFLDPRDPADWNYKWGRSDDPDGEIVVCHVGKGEDKDIPFTGDPTPDMLPLDDEAKAISESFQPRWNFRPEEAENPGQFSQSLVDKFQSEMAEVAAKPVQIEGLSDLVAALAVMTQSNQALLANLAAPKPERRF